VTPDPQTAREYQPQEVRAAHSVMLELAHILGEYARRAQVELPPLSEFERMRTKFAELSRAVEPVMAKA